MKSSLSLIASICTVFEASSFVMPIMSRQSQPVPSSAVFTVRPSVPLDCKTSCKHTALYSATVGQSDTRDKRSSRPRRTPTINEQLELETIRKELIQKYLSMGHSLEDASSEVEYFLADEERSREYVEMRRIAMARGNDLGIEMIVQFGGAFFVGWLASALVHHLDSIQAANQGGLPWIS